MVTSVCSVGGTLLASPFPNGLKPARAEAFFLAFPYEFAMMAAVNPRSLTPINISSGELLDLLVELVDEARHHLVDHAETYVQLSMPATMRLPERLLNSDVLLAVDPRQLFERAIAENRQAIMIEQRLRRFATEDADNTIVISWTFSETSDDVREALKATLQNRSVRIDKVRQSGI